MSFLIRCESRAGAAEAEASAGRDDPFSFSSVTYCLIVSCIFAQKKIGVTYIFHSLASQLMRREREEIIDILPPF